MHKYHNLIDKNMKEIGQTDIFFGEDAQTFYVDNNTLSIGTGYNSSHLGMPEWGIRHRTRPELDTIDWGRNYRQCCTTNSWGGSILASKLMGAEGLWNHKALYDYYKRYLNTEERCVNF